MYAFAPFLKREKATIGQMPTRRLNVWLHLFIALKKNNNKNQYVSAIKEKKLRLHWTFNDL
jgi:hypothetical protein